nr:MAG TPA: Herpesvirus glycoprotein L [Caudoviricetes sp.]
MFPMDAGNDVYDVFLRTDCSVIEQIRWYCSVFTAFRKRLSYAPYVAPRPDQFSPVRGEKK